MAPHSNGRAKLRFGTFDVDVETGELYKRGIPVQLQDKPFQILVMLPNPGELITREQLQNRLWPNGTFVDFEKGLNTAVKKLRVALGDSAESPIFIETLSRRGYRFIAPISSNGSVANPAFPVAASGLLDSTGGAEPVLEAHAQAPPLVEMPSGPVRSRYLLLIIIPMLAAVAAVLGLRGYKPRPGGRNLDLKDMQITKLTDNGKVRHMAISPDGHFVVYALRDGLDQVSGYET